MYIKSGHVDDAEAELRAGVVASPDSWQMKQLLVAFLSDQRGLDPAEKEIKSYIQANPDNTDLYFWLADLYVKHQAVDRAVALLQDVIAKQTDEPPGLNARTSLAQISFARGNRDLAQKLLAIVLEKDPGNHDALFVRAGISVDLGRYEGAVSDLRSILRDNPNDKKALQLLAEALLREGHLDLAIDTLSQLVEIDPANSAARVRLAQMYHLSGNSQRAMSMLAIVTNANPAYAVGWESTARIATDLKDWSTAETAISKLAPLPGQKPTSQFLEGEVLNGQGKYQDAITQYSAVINVDPKAPIAEHALISLVNSYHRLNNIEAAAHYIETIKADTPLISTILGECYEELGRQDAAAKAFDHAIEIDDGRPEPYLDKARQLLSEKKLQDAEDLLKKGVVAVPSDPRIALMLGETQMVAGHSDEAISTYEDLLSRNPAMDVAANNMAELIADNKYNDPAALEKARLVADRFRATKNPLLLDTVAWVYYRLGNIPQAITLLQQANQTPNVPAQVHYHYGVVLLKANQKDLAKQQLQMATGTNQIYPGLDEAKRLLGTL
jgi:tetratricopeptide (TPR) repeat protein